jgi:lysozyme
MSRAINNAGLELLKHFESCYLEAYLDPVGIWTIGYGHTGLVHNDGTVKAGRKVTRAQAEELLAHDLGVFGPDVEKLVKVAINDNQFAALVSFHFNTGGLAKSTLLKLLNGGEHFGAAAQFERWNKAGGKVLRGLTRRRLSERNLFCSFPDPIVKT